MSLERRRQADERAGNARIYLRERFGRRRIANEVVRECFRGLRAFGSADDEDTEMSDGATGGLTTDQFVNAVDGGGASRSRRMTRMSWGST